MSEKKGGSIFISTAVIEWHLPYELQKNYPWGLQSNYEIETGNMKETVRVTTRT